MSDPLISQETIENAKIALKHRLFVPGWQMRELLLQAAGRKQPLSPMVVELLYRGDQPVAVGLSKYTLSENIRVSCIVHVFVRKTHRRQGLGRQLVHQLTQTAHQHHCEVKCFNGVDGSEVFWQRMSEQGYVNVILF